jgi:hypothetical protein
LWLSRHGTRGGTPDGTSNKETELPFSAYAVFGAVDSGIICWAKLDILKYSIDVSKL